MAKKTKLSEQSTQAEKSVGEILSKTDRFVDKYLKQVLIAVVTVIIIVVGIIAFRHYYLVPREKNAEAALFPGQNYFAGQQWETALNGDSIEYIGFLGVIDEFGGTASANLAKAYAGLCQYQLGAYEDALKSLKSYKAKDRLFAAQVIGAIGDCEVNRGNVKESIAHFRKAADQANSSLLSPIYLQKEAVAYESLGDYKAALEVYKTIQSKYPQSPEAASIDKYIERAKAMIK
ncbi:MAG: tetratricopeptide repeat protein [Dysgonamonadaceae bacterium]|jgi:tetratricopeptide (TPR) repeat protein|nr:tetratricopeptide repeat protein [Dysgonamonadaceae bacterium]